MSELKLVNHFSSTLAYFFASFLSGQSVAALTGPKYVCIYPVNAESLMEAYESSHQNLELMTTIQSLASSKVRISDEVEDTSISTKHCASFITTFNGLDIGSANLPDAYKSSSCLALVWGSNLLAATDMDENIYAQLRDGLRVDLDWKISLD